MNSGLTPYTLSTGLLAAKMITDIQRAIDGHNLRNEELLRDLRERGVDLKELRSTEHHFWAYSHASAESLADELRKRGYVGPTISRRRAAAESHVWSVAAAFTRSFEEAGSKKVTD